MMLPSQSLDPGLYWNVRLTSTLHKASFDAQRRNHSPVSQAIIDLGKQYLHGPDSDGTKSSQNLLGTCFVLKISDSLGLKGYIPCNGVC